MMTTYFVIEDEEKINYYYFCTHYMIVCKRTHYIIVCKRIVIFGLFFINEMSYRRDYQDNESIALPLETTFNSSINGVIDEVYSNRLYFKYPPERNTSNVNKK